MSQAIQRMDGCLLGIIRTDQTILCAHSLDEINRLLQDDPDATLFYNQGPKAIEIKDGIQLIDGQQCIEIFQDTEGVFGLRAYLLIGKIQTPITLELSD